MSRQFQQASLPRWLFQTVGLSLMVVLAAAGAASVYVGSPPALWLAEKVGSKLAAAGLLTVLGAVVAMFVVVPFRTFTDLTPLHAEAAKVGGLLARGQLIESVRAQGDELERKRGSSLAGQREYDATMGFAGLAVSIAVGVVLAVLWDFAPNKVLGKLILAAIISVGLTAFYLGRWVWMANRLR